MRIWLRQKDGSTYIVEPFKEVFSSLVKLAIGVIPLCVVVMVVVATAAFTHAAISGQL